MIGIGNLCLYRCYTPGSGVIEGDLSMIPVQIDGFVTVQMHSQSIYNVRLSWCKMRCRSVATEKTQIGVWKSSG